LATQQEAVQHSLAGKWNRRGLIKKYVETRLVSLEPRIGLPQSIGKPRNDGWEITNGLPRASPRYQPRLNAGLNLNLQACAVVRNITNVEPTRKAEHRSEVRSRQPIVPIRQIAKTPHNLQSKVVRKDLLELPNKGLVRVLLAVGEQSVENR